MQAVNGNVSDTQGFVPVEKRNIPMEKALTQMALYVKEAKANLKGDELIRTCTDSANKISICFREKLHGMTDDGEVDIEESWGIARCNPNDKFNKTIGEYIAVKRARNGKIPKTIRPFI